MFLWYKFLRWLYIISNKGGLQMIHIGNELPGVRVVRHPTIAAAIQAGLLPKGALGRSPKELWEGLLRKVAGEWRMDGLSAETLRQPLIGEHEDRNPYYKTLALASLKRGMSVRELYSDLTGQKCHPASLSEGMAYLPIVSRHVEIDVVLHLGTCIRDDAFHERRLLTRRGGIVEWFPFYPARKLKPGCHVVVVKEGT
jgi:hypothetical protein